MLAADTRTARPAEGGVTLKSEGSQCPPLPKGSNSAARTIARLKRDRPDLAAQVISSEMEGT